MESQDRPESGTPVEDQGEEAEALGPEERNSYGKSGSGGAG